MVPRDHLGFTLIELVVSLVVLAVAIAALMSTVPMLAGNSTSEDAQQLAREGRSCAEVLLLLEDARELEIKVAQDPDNWANSGTGNDALEALCGTGSQLDVGAETDTTSDGSAIYRVTIGLPSSNLSDIILVLPQ